MTDSDTTSLEGFRRKLGELAHSASPRLRDLARWLSDRPEELAFQSVRGLAEMSGSNPSTVMRLAQALGYSGYDEARAAVQQALRDPAVGYGARARALAHRPLDQLLDDLRDSALANVTHTFEPTVRGAIADCVPHLLGARRIYCIGVRMSYSIAHYFTYRGAMAHANVVPVPGQPGLIVDMLADAGPEDIILCISFAHYSAEVLRASDVARMQGARVLAITDSQASPLAQGAWQVICPPLRGPHLMYPMSGAFLVIETMLEAMAAMDPQAQARVERFEDRLLSLGAYRKG